MKRVALTLCAAILPLAALASAMTLPIQQPLKPRQLATHRQQPHPKGKWYLASTGHAVYCYGPVMIVGTWDGGFAQVATICRGGVPMVKLKD
ncbi:MAG TPA: hypothetical protein VJN48_15390 [Terriglobales bacterium]|nr:hypothetical protein [Terriglobales bacterium]